LNQYRNLKFTYFKFLILSFLLVIGLLPSLFGLGAVYNKSKNELLASNGLYFREVAAFTAFQVESILEEKLNTVDRLALLPSVYKMLVSPQETDGTEFKNFKKIIEPEMASKGIIFDIKDTSGNVVFSSDITSYNLNIGRPDSAPDVIDRKYISDVVIPDSTKEDYYINLYVPIRDEEGKNIGSIQAKYIVNQLFETIKNIRIGKTGHANLVISSGEILVCPIFPPISHKINNELLNLVSSGSGWAVVNDDAHGSSGSLIGYTPVDLMKSELHPDSFGKKNWFIFTRQEPSETFKPLEDYRMAVIGYAIMLALLVLTLGVLAFRQIMKAQKAHQSDVVHREKAESVKQLMEGFQEMMLNPINEFGQHMDEFERRINGDKSAFLKIKKIRRHLSGLESLIDNLKYYTRTKGINLKPVDLTKIVGHSISMLDYLIEEKNISISFEKPEKEVTLLWDERLLSIVVLNIILNAIHSLDGKGEIGISIENRGGRAVCSVVDNGKGISKDKIDRVYDPFFTTKKGRNSYGLGLSASRGIIEEHGGTISIRSHEGKGTSVVLML